MKILKWILRVVIGVAVALLLFSGGMLIRNRSLPTASTAVKRLTTAEKANLTEFIQLRQTLGELVWPGWGDVDIPLVVYNEAYAFLIGVENPPVGWITVPEGEAVGGAWEAVPDDLFMGTIYYRQLLPESGETPQAFTVQVGERWAASLGTQEYMTLSLNEMLQADLPAFIAAVLPYRLIDQLFIRGSDGYISLIAHESFHAFQGEVAPNKLAAAETSIRAAESAYPWDAEAFVAAWQTELDLLAAALRTEDEAEMRALTAQFLAQREARRASANLAEAEIAYEQQREWLEGLARYVELEVWRQASLDEGYQSSAAVQARQDFEAYAGFEQRWTQEVDQIGRMADDVGSGRFYYSGMAQAFLLDQLRPGWKGEVMDDGVFLEDLLATAVAK